MSESEGTSQSKSRDGTAANCEGSYRSPPGLSRTKENAAVSASFTAGNARRVPCHYGANVASLNPKRIPGLCCGRQRASARTPSHGRGFRTDPAPPCSPASFTRNASRAGFRAASTRIPLADRHRVLPSHPQRDFTGHRRPPVSLCVNPGISCRSSLT